MSSPDKTNLTFKLTRYYSIASLIGILVVLVVLVLFYRHFAIAALKQHETRDNTTIAQVFASSLWSSYAAYIKQASSIPKDQLRHRPETALIRSDVLRQMHGLSVVKVKIYNLDGLTVFSTDPSQIGEDKSNNSGFLAAKSGVSVSEITFRNRFDAFEQVINDRNLISSYVPIRISALAPVEGVMEVYSDVTTYVEKLEETTWGIVGVALGSFMLLYAFLFVIVRRADKVIISQHKEVQDANQLVLQHNALHDSLTGLPNREFFTEHVNDIITENKSANKKFVILCLKFGDERNIHASLGYKAADHLVQEVGKRLMVHLREVEMVGRIDSNHFITALTSSFIPIEVEQIIGIIEKIQSGISKHAVKIDDTHRLTVNTSVGIAIYPDDGLDSLSLIQNASLAQDHAEKLGFNNYQFHKATMNTQALHILEMERDLRQALEQQQFALHYQPQVDFSGKIVGMEALIRWHHPEKGLISPAIFIPIAEERGLIFPIGEWVLQEACRQTKVWQVAGFPPLVVAVNLSALQFQRTNITQEIALVLQEHNLAPEYLDLELTENLVLHDVDETIQVMNRLRTLGVKISLDDFGTGYSNLNQLKKLPLNKLKIDQSFVRDIQNDSSDLAISTAIIAMGKALNLTMIAEGVETQKQMDVLRSIGCDEVQGYFIAKPLPAEQFAQFVQDHHTT